MHSILQFLELELPPHDSPIPPFVSGKTYMYDYFTKGERLRAKNLVHAISSRETWSLVGHYFDDDE